MEVRERKEKMTRRKELRGEKENAGNYDTALMLPILFRFPSVTYFHVVSNRIYIIKKQLKFELD